MAASTIKTRIQLKNDTEENWNKAINFIPKQGEVIIYSTDDAHPFSRLKVGDGFTTVINLPFIDAATLNGRNIEVDTKENWLRKNNYIPKSGDIIIYLNKDTVIENGQNINIPGIKIGDGLAYAIDLPFLGDEIMAQLQEHLNDMVIHITNSERIFWNNKLNCEYNVEEEVLQLNRN